jgi:hypothetical protein
MKLPALRIAEPCTEDWHAMDGDTRSRHCDRCQTSVLDLSRLTTPEARAALADPTAPPPCVRYLHAPDGSIITRTDQHQRLASLLRSLARRPAR